MVLDAKRTWWCFTCLAWPVVGLLVASGGGAAFGTEADFHQLVHYVEAASVGQGSGDRAFIRVGEHIFFDEAREGPQLAGLYLVAINQSRVLHQFHYNTSTAPGASEGLARDVEKLPNGTLVVVAAKNNAVRRFDERGQQALISIGAKQGLLHQNRRASYLCIGMKGLAPGKAIEKVGLGEQRFVGKNAGRHFKLVFPKKVEPALSKEPGLHEDLTISHTKALYYIPKYFEPQTAEYLVAVHGAGEWHRPGALNRIAQFRHIADIENLVIIAPSFEGLLNWPVNRRIDMDDNGRFIDRRIIKDWHLMGFQRLLNKNNHHRSDLKLIEIFEFFRKNLMNRERFHLYGHSGGGQFVHRFATFYPELIGKIAFSAAGTFTFPRRDKDYPWGIRMANLEEWFGQQIEADDLRLSESQMTERLNRLLDLQVFVIVGQEDTAVSGPRRLEEVGRQGRNHIERARNYYAAMRREHEHQKAIGNRPRDDPFRFEIHELPGVGHDSEAGADKAIELLFPQEPMNKGNVLAIDFQSLTARDSSGKKNRIESKSAPTLKGGHASFSGRDKQYLRVDLNQESDLLGCTAMTIRVMVRMDPSGRRHRFARILQTSDNKAHGTYLMVHERRVAAWIQTTSPTKTKVGDKRRKGRSPEVKSETAVDDGKWHDVTLTYTGKAVELYIDGRLHDQVAWTGRLINFDRIDIGYVKSNGFHYDGDMDEIQIDGRCLPPK
ncbi:MAG: LamG-like jellyroll fold domain-containing protein [Dehalococcoidia bacterium]